MFPGVALAQTETLLVSPVLPFDYDRDRNVSVTERPRPDYDALGIRSGGFLLFPRIELGAGYSSNIYLSEANEIDAPFGEATASIRANSDWSRHQVSALLTGTARRYLDNSDRNEDVWRSALLGRLDIGATGSITGEAQAAKVYDTPFAGTADNPFFTLSSYHTASVSVRGQYSIGRTRLQLGISRAGFEFGDVRFPDGTRFDQTNRDRTITAVALQGAYALSPAISGYGQLSFSDTDYDVLLAPGIANRDSNGYRALAGVNFDLPAQIRGTIAVGYTRRDFQAVRYRDVGGFSAEARVEWFPTQLTTVTFAGRRVIEDSSLGDVSAFFDNRVALTVDHELLVNLLLSATGEYAHQDYIDSDRTSDIVRVSAAARYLVSPLWSGAVRLSYSDRQRDGTNYEGSLNEFRGVLSVTFHP